MVGNKPFSDLDFSDDVALLTEMLPVGLLLLTLDVMNHEAKSLGLQVNWLKTKIRTTDASFCRGSLGEPFLVSVVGDNVEIVE